MPTTPTTPREQQLLDENKALDIAARTARTRAAELAIEVKSLAGERDSLRKNLDAVTIDRDALQLRHEELAAHAAALKADHQSLVGMLQGFADGRPDGAAQILRRVERLEVEARIAALQAHAATLEDA